MTEQATAFDLNTQEYDDWFNRHPAIYQSELLAVQRAIPPNVDGIEIGVGTGRFAQPLGIKTGVEPSASMARIAEERGIKVDRAFAEYLPFKNESFDFALMVTTVCFLTDIPKSFSEVMRILKPGGAIILGIIDKNSALGKKYEREKSNNKYYKDAHFHSVEEITEHLEKVKFHSFSFWQTLANADSDEVEQPTEGYGKGSFVVIRAIK